MGAGPAELAGRLAEFLRSESGDPQADVSALQRMTGGASRELWSLEARLRGETRALVLRRDPPGREGDAGDRGLEAALIRAADETGVPVPRVHWCCTDPAVLGSSFFLMDRIDGETIARRLLRDADYAGARREMGAQLGEALARIHRIDPAAPALAGLRNDVQGGESARAEVSRVAQGIRALASEPHPVLDLAERWLLERAPAPRRATVVHGDFRIGNVIFGPDGLRAVLDWELAHVGDPIEDLGWLCVKTWRFGSDLPVGGIATREALVSAYEAAGGEPVDPDALTWWEACGNFKLALVWIMQSEVFLSGRVASLELASLGRRTAEPEAELLRFLEETP